MAKQWCIVIPFGDNKTKAKYACLCLKDYVVLSKYLKELELDGSEELVDYAYLEALVARGGKG
jgi:hypothetical protein